MSLLIRKVNKSKWFQNDIKEREPVSADAITSCLRTYGNTLSVWEIESGDELDEAVLAIVAAHQHLESIDVIHLSPEYLTKNGIDCVHSKGRTPVDDLAENHVDLAKLTYEKLGVIAYHIVDRIVEHGMVRYTRTQ